ncbi:MAG: hypothetical protein ACRYGP_19190 [Janthinobacterium lividum]
MSRDTAVERIRNAKPGETGAKAMGQLGRQIGGAYDRASAAAEQAYEEAQDAYNAAVHAAEQGYEDARVAAEDAYHQAQQRAEALAAESKHLYDQAMRRGQAYSRRAASFTGDNKALALVLAGGVGFLLALVFKRK